MERAIAAAAASRSRRAAPRKLTNAAVVSYSGRMIGYWLLVSLAAACAAFWAYVTYAVVRSIWGIPLLREVGIELGRDAPRLHAVVAARDEGETIERALASLAGQTYGPLLVSVVDDRSTDGTGEAIARISAAARNVRPLRVDELPEGWLGKVHALKRGVEGIKSRWILFTDADVRFVDRALSRAVGYAEANELDLLTAFPEVESAGVLADSAFDVVALLMAPAGRLYAMPNPRSRAVGAAGAFILVRQSAWEKSEGFDALRLEVADDFGIATLVKRAGGRCAIVNGVGLIRLRWYTSLSDMIGRTQKNFWAVVGRFSVARLLVAAAVMLTLAWAPLLLLSSPHDVVRWTAAPAASAMLVASVANAAWLERRIVPSLLLPVGVTLLAYMMVRAAIEGRRIGGVRWRETFYSSEQLEAGRVVRF